MGTKTSRPVTQYSGSELHTKGWIQEAALSTDANPGSSPTLSLQFIMNLGCLRMGMTPEEVLTATTINAAHAIGRGDSIGSLEVEKMADITIFDVKNYYMLSYNYGMNHVDKVIKGGELVVG